MWIIRALAVISGFMAVVFPSQAGRTGDDPFLWLENVNGARALRWVHDRNELTLAQLKGDPSFAGMQTSAENILNQPDTLTLGQIAGGFVFAFVTDAGHPLGLWRRTAENRYAAGRSEWDDILDMGALNAQEHADWQWRGAKCQAPEYVRCLLFLSHPKHDTIVVREFDLASRSFVHGGFNVSDAKTSVEWVDQDQVLIATDWGKGSLTRAGNPRFVKLWSRGQNLADAKPVYEAADGDREVLPLVTLAHTGEVNLFVIRKLTGNQSQIFHIDENLRALRITVPEHASFKAFHKGQLIFQLGQDWFTAGRIFAQGSLISFSLKNYLTTGGALPRMQQLYVPGKKTALTAIAATRDAIFLSRLENVQGQISELTFNGRDWLTREIDLPKFGSVTIISSNNLDDRAIIKYENFTTPDGLYWLQKGGEPTLIRRLTPRFDATGVTVSQYEATSADGAEIPYFVVRHGDTGLQLPSPMLLYAYGGFQISTTPWYWSSAGKLWLEQGGAYAIANIRGGGEFGPAWHAAAAGAYKQKNFDDMAAVAEDLVKRGLTSPRHLGIFGSSQGGLLVAGTFVQRPELFNAVVSQVPLTDMLRYTKLAASQNWTAEYGDPDDPRMRNIIQQWSPYQNIKPGVKYPNIFLLTSTKDTRVHPGHARKMAAKLQSLGQPVLYYEGTDSSERAEQLALTFTYFRRALMD